MNPTDLKYSRTHEWINAEGDVATIGVTDYAQSELGEIVFLELPQAGSKFRKGDALGTIESYKTVSDLMAPVSGEVIEINPDLADSPQFVNESPYDQGWMIKIKMSDPSELNELMSAEDYEGILKEH